MTELQRSVTSFRRQGSSGLVWDDKFIAGIEKQQQESGDDGSSPSLQRSRSAGAPPYRTVNVAPQAMDPPSPKLATCGFCALFRKPVSAKPNKSKRRTRWCKPVHHPLFSFWFSPTCKFVPLLVYPILFVSVSILLFGFGLINYFVNSLDMYLGV